MDPIATHRQTIAAAAATSPLAATDTVILGASKAQPAAVIEEFIGQGLVDFGENRVQEAEAKWPAIKTRHPHVRLHLIGPLQTNKVREALALFDVIQTIDRPKLADAIANETPVGKAFFIQVNTGEEPQKSGVSLAETVGLIQHCRARGLNVVGLMCVPPAGDMPAPHFALLRKLALENGLSQLSMGMSDDYETAIRMGSTCVRIGRALFGQRKP